MDILSAFGLAVPAGLNAYIPMLAVALAQRFGWLELNAPFGAMGEWWAIGLIAVLLAIEVLADKIPAVDHVNDVVQTVVRPAAGGIAFVAASGAAGRSHPVLMLVVGIVLAGGVHAVKALSRPAVNATTAGVGTWVASTAEDGMALVSSVLAVVAPIAAAAFVAACVWVALRVLSRGRRALATDEPGG